MNSAAGTPRTWCAPGRVNLIGEHTDYNDGFCLPLAIEQSASATVSSRQDGLFSVRSAQLDATVVSSAADLIPGRLAGSDQWAGYVLGAVWALRSDGYDLPPLHIEIDSDVPSGAGLSSSAALECAALTAVADFAGIRLAKSDVVALARRCENDFVGAPTGGMDQLASVFGEADHALLCDMRTLSVRPLPLGLTAAGLSILVIDSKAPHRLTDGPYAERRRSCEEAARTLGVLALRDIRIEEMPAVIELLATGPNPLLARRARHVITENARTLACAELLAAGRIADIGTLLSASHASLRDDFEVSVPEVDLAVRTMLDAGALGARITGGGFGGCAISLIATAAVPAAITAVMTAFRGAGFNSPVGFRVRPSQGAHPISKLLPPNA
jgi:galactokinase